MFLRLASRSDSELTCTMLYMQYQDSRVVVLWLDLISYDLSRL